MTTDTESDIDPRQVLKEYVSKNGLKLTRQRELIAEVFFAAGAHLSAEEMLEKVRAEDGNISLATVYRTLKLLTQCGLAEPHKFSDNHTVYEPARGDEEHHDHIICKDCDQIIEFFDQRIETLQEEIARGLGFEVVDHRMELYGRCQKEDCPNKKA